MPNDHAPDQHGRQAKRCAGAMPGQIQRQRHGAGRRQLGQGQDVGELIERRQLKAMAGDDADRAQNDQAGGGAEEPAHDGIGHITDRAAHPRHPEAAQHDAGDDGRKPKRHQRRGQQRCRGIAGDDVLDQRRRQYSGHRRRGTLGSRNGEREGASPGDDSGEDGRGDEGRGKSVGQIWRQRAGKNQKRIRQAKCNREDTGGAAAENVIEGLPNELRLAFERSTDHAPLAPGTPASGRDRSAEITTSFL